MTDRHDSVKSGNDQWIGRQISIRLKALWVQVVPTSELVWGDEVQWSWDPALEFQPSIESPETKGKGKGKLPIPHKLPHLHFRPRSTSTRLHLSDRTQALLLVWK